MPSDYEKICRENIEEYGKGTRLFFLLERLYSERTHFIFELLQNAEDAGATHVRFHLLREGLEVRHDGRLFDEKDVRGVCGIAEGTKENDLTQIGKFGIGFKSVYAFTIRPQIHCGDEHFAIEKYIRPQSVDPLSVPPPWTTLFMLPFNRPEVAPDLALTEIAHRLANLNSRTMLFLRHITEIEWSLPDGAGGRYLRQETPKGPARRVSVTSETTDRQDEETWLIFEAPVVTEAASDPLRVEVAFSVTKEEKSGKEQIRRVDAADLCVFFPTEKSTGLGFLIQGPYRTTPARDNVPKDDAWNVGLVRETAALVAATLAQLRDLGFLSAHALQAMPLRQADFLTGTMFRPIFDAVAEILQSEPLIPADSEKFVSASNAKISRGSELRKLFSTETLTALPGGTARLQWVSAEITEYLTPDLYTYFRQILKIEEVTPESIVRQLSRSFLEKTSDEWLMRFYEFLEGQGALWRKPQSRWEQPGPARSVPIIRLEEGTHVPPFRYDGTPSAYLSAPVQYDDIPLVKRVFVEQERSREFLQKLGIGEFDVLATIREKIAPRYVPAPTFMSAMEHVDDIRSILQALEGEDSTKRPGLLNFLRSVPIVLARNALTGAESYRKPGDVYYPCDELEMYFSGNCDAWFLCSVYPAELTDKFELLGVERMIKRQRPESETDRQGNTILADARGHHCRGLDGFDPNFDVDGLSHALSHPTSQRSVYVWENIARPHSRFIRGVVEWSSYQDFRHPTSRNEWSKMGETLSTCAWLPHNGQFARPDELSLDDLPADFRRDDMLGKQLEMRINTVAMLAREIGVGTEEITLAKRIAEDPELYHQVRQLIEARAQKPEFPSRTVPNPERRVERITRDAEESPPKTYEERQRSVRTSEPPQDPSTWLRESYTNSSEQMVCQICEREMPFKKRDGQYYFESVEAFIAVPSEHHAVYLALCPVCAAKYKEFVKHDPAALACLQNALIAAEKPLVSVQFGIEATTLRFVDSHFLDLQTILKGGSPDS